MSFGVLWEGQLERRAHRGLVFDTLELPLCLTSRPAAGMIVRLSLMT